MPASVHIYSDGTPETTRITDAHGHEIPDVVALEMSGDRDGIVVSLLIRTPRIDADATKINTALICPVCQKEFSHKCNEENKGDEPF